MAREFVLDEQLGRGPLVVDWPLCQVRLENDARYPWLVLVPRRADVSEIFDLNESDRAQFFFELTSAAQRMAGALNPTKMNVGMLGNMVPQLHGHVIARFEGDAAWPKPVWGLGAAEPYPAENWEEVTFRYKGIIQTTP